MSLTNDERYWMDKREELTEAETWIVDSAFNRIYADAAIEDVKAAKDDRVAALEAAMIRFLIESREGARPKEDCQWCKGSGEQFGSFACEECNGTGKEL